MSRPIIWIFAYVLGALAPTLLTASVEASGVILVGTFVVALGHALILGHPTALYFIFRRWTELWRTIVAGAVIGAMPLGLLLLVTPTGYSFAGGVELVADGKRTTAGWINFFETVVFLAALGAAGALAAWLTLWLSGELQRVRSDDTSKLS